jgi:hypothetical protein
MTSPITDINGSAGGGDSYRAPEDLPGAPAQADPFNGFENYYSFDEKERWYFPDGKQWIEFRKLTEGDRAKYLKATRSDVHLNQKSGEARIPFDQSADRKELLLHSITDWYMAMQVGDAWQIVPFQPGAHKGGTVAQWIDRANPAILGGLEKAIRKANPWLLNEMSSEQIRKEITDLEELLVVAEKREAEEGNSSSK